MINPKELRIGNIVYHSIMKECKVYFIGERYYDCTTDGKNNFVASDSIPIQLNDDWMQRCGFQVFPWGWVKKSSSDFGVRINLTSYNYEVSGNSSVELKYLHKLQNLYFSLTGEELPVNMEW
jgi:hypothetical protein